MEDSALPSLDDFVQILDDMRNVDDAKAKPGDRNAARLCISIVQIVPEKEKHIFDLALRKALYRCTPWNPAAWRLAHREMGVALHDIIGDTKPPYMAQIIAVIHNR